MGESLPCWTETGIVHDLYADESLNARSFIFPGPGFKD